MLKIGLFVALVAVLVSCGSAYRILCPYPTMSRSHFIVADALFRGLAARGHEVTVFSPFPPDKPIPNYRHVKLEYFSSLEKIFEDFVKNPNDGGLTINMFRTVMDVTLNGSSNMIHNPYMQTIMTEEQFDLVIIEYTGELHVGLAAHFDCPVIVFASVKPINRILEIVSNPLALSYAKSPMCSSRGMSRFMDRLNNMFYYLMEKVVLLYFSPQFVAFHNEHFPQNKYPPLQDILDDKIAAVFVAHHFSQGDVRPLVPGVIEISGIQMTETASPLPDALQSWMDQSTNGVIFFSLGSNLKLSSLSSDKLEAIINVFKTRKENILWKSDVATIPGLSNNVRLEKWVSQIDVLQHKNIKLFITHGGLGSIDESKFYGVPVLVLPMIFDQIGNADLVVTKGWGVKLLFTEFTEEKFQNSLDEVLSNPVYTNQAKYESMLFRDRPLTPLQTGIFWVEYIIRHKGAHHMRSNARHLNWFQLHSLDVIGFLSAVLLIWAYLSYRILKCVIKKLFGAKRSKDKQKKT